MEMQQGLAFNGIPMGVPRGAEGVAALWRTYFSKKKKLIFEEIWYFWGKIGFCPPPLEMFLSYCPALKSVLGTPLEIPFDPSYNYV